MRPRFAIVRRPVKQVMERELAGTLLGDLASRRWVVGKNLSDVSLGVAVKARDQGIGVGISRFTTPGMISLMRSMAPA